jgi:hypothetical protein
MTDLRDRLAGAPFRLISEFKAGEVTQGLHHSVGVEWV